MMMKKIRKLTEFGGTEKRMVKIDRENVDRLKNFVLTRDENKVY